MNAMNSIIIEGNIVRKPTAAQTKKGTPLCVFSVANNRFYRNYSGAVQKETSFFDVETWAELATQCAELGDKGGPVRSVGRLKQYRWKNAEGKNCNSVRVVAEHVEFKTKTQLNSEVDDLVEDENPIEEVIHERQVAALNAIRQ